MTSAAAVALGLVVAGGSVAYASTGGSAPPGQLAPGAGGPHARPAAVGTVKSVGASSFVLTTHAGTQVTVDVTGQTIYRDPKVTTPSLSDVTPGAHVAVLGTTSSSTVTATTVLVGLPPRPGPGGPHARPAAVGTVKSVGASSFVLTTHAGTQVTVDVTGQTIYRDPKVTTPSLSDVTPGAHVAVLGTTSSSTVTATTVLVGLPPRPGPGGPHARPAAGAVGAATA
ncbi:MAG: DUF5666 domain-containing protein [Actinomycetota bacterium]|nr:DUF5666 domain-containing protein [Actinomycetota bacterium]